MATLNIRNLPETVRAKLRIRAAKADRSMEAEARAILEPIDVLILRMIFSEKLAKFPDADLSKIRFEKTKIAQTVGADIKAVEMSLLNLMRVSCIKPGLVETGGLSFGALKNTVYQGTDFFHLSELGVALCLAAMTAPE